MRKFFLILPFLTLIFSPAFSAEKADSPEAFLKTLNLRNGLIDLPNGITTINVPESFRYIGQEDSKRFLEEGWNNPDGSGQIGMLLPMDVDLFGDNGWAVVISYEEDGHISDKEAEKINYDELLKSMQKSTEESNDERVKKGYTPIKLVGWATPPQYDSQSKKLYWAKELSFSGDQTNTLNYNVRILGRNGVLVMNAVSSMNQLPMIHDKINKVISFADFKEGNRYNDFDPGIDKVAAYGLTALIGGKIAAKAGLLAKLGGLLIAFKKFIIIGLAAIGGLIGKIFKRKKD